MIEATLSQAAEWCEGLLVGADRPFAGVSTDTRTLTRGQLFVALAGERFDAHGFLDRATAGGASGALVQQDLETTLSRVRVDDSRRSLGHLARAWRDQLGARVVALTGSSGKTTVKEMIASILHRRGVVSATAGNLNNDIGLPLTLLRAGRADDYLVLEMGANAPGDIAYLVSLAKPHVALLNNAGPAHLEGFGSLAGVAAAKGEIFAGLGRGGIAVFNGDDPQAPLWRRLAATYRRVEFGFDAGRDVRGVLLEPGENRLRIEFGGASFDVTVPLPGRHNAANALAAAAAAFALGVDAAGIREGIEAAESVTGRLKRVRGRSGAVLVDDSYNANPASLEAGLEACSHEGAPLWLVLGDMKELGPASAAMHREAGRTARKHGCSRLFTFGELAAEAVDEFGPGAERHARVETLCDAVEAALRGAPEEVTVLVKGSRAMRLERVVAHLAEPEDSR